MKKTNRYRYTAFLILLLGLILTGCVRGTGHDTSPEADYREKAVKISEVTLGSGDELDLMVWRNDDLSGKYVVDSAGKLFIPLVGTVQAEGISATELRKTIMTRLSTYLVNPQVKLTVLSYPSRKVYVLGEVKKPGLFQADDGMTMIDAVSKAGGFTDEANAKSVLLIKGGLDKPNLSLYNMTALLKDGDLRQNVRLEKGDIVYVPVTFITKADRFFRHLSTIISPIVEIERGIIIEPFVEDVLLGGSSGSGNTIVVPK